MISRFCSHPFNTSYCVDRNSTFINQKFSFESRVIHVTMSHDKQSHHIIIYHSQKKLAFHNCDFTIGDFRYR